MTTYFKRHLDKANELAFQETVATTTANVGTVDIDLTKTDTRLVLDVTALTLHPSTGVCTVTLKGATESGGTYDISLASFTLEEVGRLQDYFDKDVQKANGVKSVRLGVEITGATTTATLTAYLT